MQTKRRPIITAETFRPQRVDDQGLPDIVTGDAPPDAPAPEPTSSPAPAPAAPSVAAPAPAPVPATAAAPEPAPPAAPEPSAAGLTTAEILAALGTTVAPGASVSVLREPSPYVEGGGISHEHGFFADLYASGTRGDVEAGRRAAQFQSQLRDYIAAASNDSASGSDVIGPAWGGSWYVDQIAQLRPLVGAFSSATITDNRPFPVPRFLDTAPSALVGDHVEGQPDTPGVVNFDQVTVTPKAKSGRAEASRELLDASPALADRVISAAPVRATRRSPSRLWRACSPRGRRRGRPAEQPRSRPSRRFGPRSGSSRGRGSPRGG